MNKKLISLPRALLAVSLAVSLAVPLAVSLAVSLAVPLAVSLAGFAPSLAIAQDDVTSRHVEGVQSAAHAQLIINQVDTSGFPKVTIFATVLKNGAPASGLSDKDFWIREDEVDQEPLTVVPKLSSLNAVLTIDTSGSIKKALPAVQAAAKGFIDILGEGDKLQVLRFSREVQVLSASGSRADAKAAIDTTVARGDTALYDALYRSVETLKDTPGRKVAVLLTDGVDDDGTGKKLSKHTVAEVLALAKQVNVPIYTIGLGTELDVAVLKQVADETGGKFFDAPKAEDLKQIYDSIGKQLSGQYFIYYTSNLPSDGTIHRVSLGSESLGGAEVRSTKEYTAPIVQAATPIAAAPAVVPVASSSSAAPVPAATPSKAPGLRVSAILRPGDKPIRFETVKVYQPEATGEKKLLETCYNKEVCAVTLPAGTYEVVAEKGDARTSVELTLAENEGRDETILLDAGVLNVTASAKEGGADDVMDTVRVLGSESILDNDLKEITICYTNKKCMFVLKAGTYTVRAQRGKAKSERQVTVKAGAATNEKLNLNAGVVVFKALLAPGGQAEQVDYCSIETAAAVPGDFDEVASAYTQDQCTFVVSAGGYRILAKKGKATVTKDIEVKVGEMTKEELVLNAGRVKVVSVLSAGTEPVKSSEIEVFSPPNTLGEQESLAHKYSVTQLTTTLPVGNYVATAKQDQKVTRKEFSVTAGGLVLVEVVTGG